jgi:RNA polymerase sigma factor (sigma-70 family)
MKDPLVRLPDAVLLARCRREPEAFTVVYDRHAHDLLRWIRSRSGDEQVALDVLQETFARALREAPRFRRRGDGSALPWLRTIARNLLHDWRRRGAVEDRMRRELGLLVDDHDPAASTDRLIARTALAGALDQLPAEQRAAVQARIVLGVGYAEIANANGITRANARARVSRGLRSLRGLLTGPQEGANR